MYLVGPGLIIKLDDCDRVSDLGESTSPRPAAGLSTKLTMRLVIARPPESPVGEEHGEPARSER